MNMSKKYKMEVIRFKKSGKFYDRVPFETDCDWMYQISEEFEQFIQQRPYWDSYDYLLSGKVFSEQLFGGEDHPNGFPCFIHSDKI